MIPQNAKEGSIIFTSNPFTHHSVFLYFMSCLLPKLTCLLISVALDTNICNKIGGVFHPIIIATMGYNRICPIALRYGTYQYSGLQMKSLEVEALMKQNIILQNLMHKDKTQKLINIMFPSFNTLLEHQSPSSKTTTNQ